MNEVKLIIDGIKNGVIMPDGTKREFDILDFYYLYDGDIYEFIRNNKFNCDELKMLNQFGILYKSKEIVTDLLDYMIVITYEYINNNKDYRKKFLNLIAIIENTKLKLMSNTNYDMCIDELLLKMWEEIDENYSRS